MYLVCMLKCLFLGCDQNLVRMLEEVNIMKGAVLVITGLEFLSALSAVGSLPLARNA